MLKLSELSRKLLNKNKIVVSHPRAECSIAEGNSGWHTAVSVLSNSFVVYNRAFPTTRPGARNAGYVLRLATGRARACGTGIWNIATIRTATLREHAPISGPFVPSSLWQDLFPHIRNEFSLRSFSFLSFSFTLLLIIGRALELANFQGDSIDSLDSWRKSVDNRGETLFFRALRISYY